jgi:putative transposase
MPVSFKVAHFPQEIILTGVRWYLAYPLSTRHVEELMEERGVELDHATINRWIIKYSPQLEEAFHRRKRPVWVNWRAELAYGRDIYQGEGRVALFVSGCGQARKDDRL